MAFAHLHVHTGYSLLDGANKIDNYITRLKDLGMTAGAITDHGVMYGVIEFYKAAKKAGINPVIGCEVYVAPGSRFEKEGSVTDDRYYHLILLAENNTGYANLSHIVSRGFTEGLYYKPRVDLELLEQYHEGIICLSACVVGAIPRAILRGNYDEAVTMAKKYDEIFGHGNFFLELQDHGLPEQATVNASLLRMHQELDIPLVATNDVHYTLEEDAEAHDALICIQTQKKVADEDRMHYAMGKFYVKSEEEMRALFPYAQEAIDNTQKIADRCHVEIEFGNRKLPHFEVPEGYDSWTYLNKLCDDGLKERYPNDDGSARARLDYELGVIKSMGFVDYFLIVWDYINYARQNGVVVGPGRGSAAGSIVSYCIHITKLDPLKYGLLFERFLNPERVTMPDVDVDFDDEGRQKVIDYVTEKYGAASVVQIITFGTMQPRAVIRDVARVLDMPFNQANELTKMVPAELKITIDKALKMNPELQAKYDNDPLIHRVIDLSKRLEGLPRHSSVHASAVVICGKPAMDLVPLSKQSDGTVTTQFEGPTIESLGLLKMDFLGLRNLTVIKGATDNANRSIGAKPGDPNYIDIDKIDYNDPKVLSFIGTGKCAGIFQLESTGMQNFMRQLKPQSLEDVIAGISLYRPGPMDFIPKYLAGKTDQSNVTYDTPELESILEPTYGCIVYQEQVMQIVQQLAGYSLGRADLVRRAMAKKHEDEMIVERDNFVNGNTELGVRGCVANGISADIANGIYDSMMSFASYAFNKSHAACYAYVAIQTAWLKYYYPVEFMASLMTSVIGNSTKTAGYIASTKAMGIQILPPDINEGEIGFTVCDLVNDKGEKEKVIRYALTAIKSLSIPTISAVLRVRNAGGKFRDLEDFLTRMQSKDAEINRRAIENLIKAGAFDSLGGTRKQYMCVYGQILDQLKSNKNNMAGQISLMDLFGENERDQFQIPLPNVGEYPKDMRLAFEKEVLGIYVSGHPLEDNIPFINKHATHISTDFYLPEQSEETGAADIEDAVPKVRDQEKVTLCGMITERTIKYTKRNEIMAFLTLEDLVGTVEIIVFPKTYAAYTNLLGEDSKVMIKGHASVEADKDAKLIADSISAFGSAPKTLWVNCQTDADLEGKKQELLQMIQNHAGKDRVRAVVQNPSKHAVNLPGLIEVNDETIIQTKAIFGEANVKVTEA